MKAKNKYNIYLKEGLFFDVVDWKIKSAKDEILEQILEEKWLLVDADSGEELVVKNSRRWQFLAAKKYPEVKIAKPIPKEVWDELNKRLAKEEEN